MEGLIFFIFIMALVTMAAWRSATGRRRNRSVEPKTTKTKFEKPHTGVSVLSTPDRRRTPEQQAHLLHVVAACQRQQAKINEQRAASLLSKPAPVQFKASRTNSDPPRRLKDIVRKRHNGKTYPILVWSDDGLLAHWTYQGRPFGLRELEKLRWSNPNGAHGFVYLTEFRDGAKYVGRKVFDRHGDWLTYIGSGAKIVKMVKKRSRASLVRARTILSVHPTPETLEAAEEAEQRRRRVVESKQYLNQIYGNGAKRANRAGR